MATTKKREATPYSAAVGAVLVSKYKKKRWNIEKVADRSGLNKYTLRRMFAGETDIEVDDLVIICRTLGVDYTAVLDEALEDIGGFEALVSEAPSTNVIELFDPRTATAEEHDAAQGFERAALGPDEEGVTDDDSTH